MENEKALTELNLEDVKVKLDTTKSYGEQTEDVLDAMATARAVGDETVAKKITDQKAEELKFKSDTKVKNAEKENYDATKNRQEAESQVYETVFQTFGIASHLPKWLMRIMVFILSPIYIVITLSIGIPFGIAKTLIDNIDNVLVRYENVDSKVKPRLKVTILAILILSVIAFGTFVVLKFFNKM